MIIRRAETADEAALMKLRVEAEEWLADAGVDQWRHSQTRNRALTKWQADVAAGRTWVVEEEGAVIGTVTLAQPDQDFWRPEDGLDDALYVGKLITARSTRGTQLGGRILDWVSRRAQAQGKAWVRLDVWRTNRALQDYYLREGFTHVRTEAPEHRLSGWMAQRPSSVLKHPQNPLSTDRKALAMSDHDGVLSKREPQMTNGYQFRAKLRDSRKRYVLREGERSMPTRGAFDMESRMSGTVPVTEVTVRREVPPADVALALGTLEPVIVRDRRMWRDDELVQLSVSYIPSYVAEAAPQVEAQDSGVGGIKSRMAEAGLGQLTAVEDVSLSAATSDQATAFDVPEGWPLLTITHTGRVADGRAVELTVHILAPGWTLRYEVPLK